MKKWKYLVRKLQNWINHGQYDIVLYTVKHLEKREGKILGFTDGKRHGCLWYTIVDNRKRFAGDLLNLLCTKDGLNSFESNSAITSKILPGLVTLSSDANEYVRISAFSGLAHIVSNTSVELLQEKACIQLISYVDDEQSHFLYVEVFRKIEIVWSDLPARFREEVLLPKIAAIFAKYGPDP